MNNRLRANSGFPSCANRLHSIRQKWSQDTVFCVPHSKAMHANNSLVCELHSMIEE